MRRAEIADARMLLALESLVQHRGDPRLADTRLTRDQHDPAFAGLCLLPAAEQKLQLLLAPDQRRRAGSQRLEPARDLAPADDTRHAHLARNALQLDRSQL